MLYEIREVQRLILNPLSDWAHQISRFCSSSSKPHFASGFPFSKECSAGFELLHRLGKEFKKPEFNLKDTIVEGVTVPIRQEVCLSRPFCNLIKFERLLEKPLEHRVDDPVVLIFAPLSGHFATLLRDTVRAFLPDHNVYITDWLDAKTVPMTKGPFGLSNYVQYVVDFIRFLGAGIHLVAVCQPTVPVLAAVSVMSDQGDPAMPKSMTMMGGPIDTRVGPTAVTNLAEQHSLDWFERYLIYRVPAKYPGAGRRVYPGFLQHVGFIAMNPSRHWKSYQEFYENLLDGDLEDAQSHRAFYDEYNAVSDLPAEYYLETIKTIFQDHALPLGNWDVFVDGKMYRVNPEKIIDVALLTIEGEKDDLSGKGQTQAAHHLCANIPQSMRKHIMVEGAGHYGIFSGRRWRDYIYLQLKEFIAEYHACPETKNVKKKSSQIGKKQNKTVSGTTESL